MGFKSIFYSIQINTQTYKMFYQFADKFKKLIVDGKTDCTIEPEVAYSLI